MEPEIFAEGTISTPDDEFGIAFMPDGQTAYFTKRSPTTNTSPRSVICVTRQIDGRWGEPQIASFSGRYNDFGITIAVDGRRIIFSSDRPVGANAREKKPDIDLWFVDWEKDGWSEPRNLGPPINSSANDAYPSLASDGTLYFASDRPGGKGGADIYRARFVNGNYVEPENLVDINGPGYESQPAIAPDQGFLVFTAFDRDGTLASAGAPYSRSDLFVSFRTADGWTVPRNLGAPINSAANEGSASFSTDGRWLFFASDRSFVSIPMAKPLTADEYHAGMHSLRNGWNNIYRVSVSAIEKMRATSSNGVRQP